MNAQLRTTRKPISLDATQLDTLIEMADGNPGAATAIAKLMEGNEFGLIDVLHLDDMNCRGCQIWVGYKDHCGGDVEKFRKAIRDRDLAMIDTINRICIPQIGERARQFAP